MFKIFLVSFLIFITNTAHALEANYFGSLYLSDAISKTTPTGKRDDFLKDYSFEEFSLFGVNLYKSIDSTFNFHAQIVATGNDGDFSKEWAAELDFLQINKSFTPRFEVIFGRQILSVFIYSSYRDIGYELPFARQPFYINALIPIKSVNAISSIYKMDNGIQLKITGGEESPDISPRSTSQSDGFVNANNLYGVDVSWTNITQEFFLHFNHYSSDIEVDINQTNTLIEKTLGGEDANEFDGNSIGFSYNSDELLFITELTETRVKSSSRSKLTQRAGYSLIGYTFDKLMLRYIYSFYENVSTSETLNSHLIGATYRASNSYLYKIEVENKDQFFLTSEKETTLVLGVDFVF